MNTDTTIITAIYHHWYNNLLRYYTSIDTTNYYATIVPLIQQAITILCHYWYNNILCYYTPLIQQSIKLLYSYDTTNYYVTILLLIQHLRILYANRYSKLLCYYIPIDTTNYYVTKISLIQQSITPPYSYWYSTLYDTKILSLQLLRHYELYCHNNSHAAKALYHSHYYATMTHTSSSYITMLHTVSTTITQAL